LHSWRVAPRPARPASGTMNTGLNSPIRTATEIGSHSTFEVANGVQRREHRSIPEQRLEAEACAGLWGDPVRILYLPNLSDKHLSSHRSIAGACMTNRHATSSNS
jgi:hypothetical protein